MMSNFLELSTAANANPPVVAVVLGSGMGRVAQGLQPQHQVPFTEVPGLPPTSTVVRIHG